MVATMDKVVKTKPHTYIMKKEEPVSKETALTTQDKMKAYAKYEPVIPQAPLDTKFHYIKEDGTYGFRAKFHMVTSVTELRELAEKCKGQIVGLDTETTGLSFGIDKIVGFSLALDDMEGYYVPIRHEIRTATVTKTVKLDADGKPVLTKTGRQSMMSIKEYTYEPSPYNLPDKECLDILYEIMLNARLSLWHNSMFDLNMLKFEGYDVMKCKTFDTMILPYIYDAEGKGIAGLKELEKRLLGRYRPGFKETVGSDENFKYTDPTKSYEYAAIDACHDDQTEVLTKNGWVFWKDYKGDIPLASPNLEANKLEWALPSRLVNYHYEGEMYHYTTRTQDWCVTPNHNMLVRHAQKADGKVEFKRADELNIEETIYLGSTEKDGKQETYMIGDYEISEVDLARLTALILADGYTQKYDKKTHCSYDTGVVYTENKNFTEISSFLNTLNFPKTHIYKRLSEVNNVQIFNWKTHYKPLWDLLRPYTEAGSREKRIPEYVFEMSSEAIREFIKFYAYCDGQKMSRNSGAFSISICTVSPYLRDGLQMLLSMIGIPSSLGFRPAKDSCIKGRMILAENCADQYFINYNSRKTRRIKKPSMKVEQYNGKVYCAEVPNHTLITRRNGKVLVSGNCSTIAIYKKLFPMVRNLLNSAPEIIELDGKKYDIVTEDNNLIRAFVDYYGHAELKIDKEEARAYEKIVNEGIAKVKEEIFSFFGRGPFNLSTQSKEFKQVMEDAHINTGYVTEKGNKSFGKDGIKELNKNLMYLKNSVFPNLKYIRLDVDLKGNLKLPKKDQGSAALNVIVNNLVKILKEYGRDYCRVVDQVNNCVVKNLDGSCASRMDFYLILKKLNIGERKKLAILNKIKDYSSYMKALNSYITKLTEVSEARICYRLQSTASSRLSSGNSQKSKGKENKYYINLNAQNLTKPKQVFYKGTPSNEEGNILGWKFEPVSDDYAHEHAKDEVIVEAGTPTTNIRKCIVAPEGRYVVAMDFSNQEARILALLSQDKRMLDIFINNEDMHTATAVAIFGEAGHDKKYRKIAKAINFALSYSGNEFTVANNLDIPVEEARSYVDTYYERFAESIRWKKNEIQKMYDQGGKVFTKFGRPRQFITRLKDANRCGDERVSVKITNAVERRVTNHEIQGMAGDICRYLLLKLYKRYFKNRDKSIDFMSTVHDEISFFINKEVIIDYIRELQDIMTFTALNGPFPLDVSIDVGNNYGQCFPFKWTDETRTKLIPDRI